MKGMTTVLLLLGLYTAFLGAAPQDAGECVLPEEWQPALVNEWCVWGFYSFWTFNKATEVATLEKVRPREVCHYRQNEDHANMRFVFRKDADIIFTNDIFWLLVTFYDYLDEDGTLQGGIIDKKEETRFISLAFPVDPQTVNHYEVIDIETGKTLGAGPIAAPCAEEAP